MMARSLGGVFAALVYAALGAAWPAAVSAAGAPAEPLTRFSQLPGLYETDPSAPVPVYIRGVVTYVFPEERDGFVIADEQRYDRGGLIVRPAGGAEPSPGSFAFEVGETVAVAGTTKYENRTISIEAASVMRTGRIMLTEPPPLKISDFRRGLRHLRRNRIEGFVESCVRQPRASGGADSALWLRVPGSRDPVLVLVRGGLKGAASRKGTLVDATGLAYTSFGANGEPLASRLDASPASVRIIVENYSPYWRVAAVAAGMFFAVASAVFCIAWLRSRQKRRVARLLDADRRRIADDLHDNMQQLLAGVGFRLSAAENVAGDKAAVLVQIAQAKKALEHSKAGLRSVLWGLQEAKEGTGSLAGLLMYAASKMPHWEGVVTIECEGVEPPGVRGMGAKLLMIMQEAVGNALVHGGARHVKVGVVFGKTGLAMTVGDDGCGFDAMKSAGSGHIGLASMRRRADELGGTLVVESAPGKGTTVRVEVM